MLPYGVFSLFIPSQRNYLNVHLSPTGTRKTNRVEAVRFVDCPSLFLVQQWRHCSTDEGAMHVRNHSSVADPQNDDWMRSTRPLGCLLGPTQITHRAVISTLARRISVDVTRKPSLEVAPTTLATFWLPLLTFDLDLVVPRTRRRTGDRAFSVSALRAWNRLSAEL